eukprot:TRINITY_DN36_c0_g1_i6.p1 TRINITY_DN36_c0_g1~~TRINITY_DN36_c0_g1_i6.p1  ORF type:complete len:311 (-),score=75.08 TRINITY_DN36_c0_g1_i6:27-959(-)
MRLDEKTSKCNKKCRKFGKAECPARCKVEGDDCVDPEEASDGDYCEDATVTNAEWYNPRTTLAAAKAACNDDSNCIGLYQGKDKKWARLKAGARTWGENKPNNNVQTAMAKPGTGSCPGGPEECDGSMETKLVDPTEASRTYSSFHSAGLRASSIGGGPAWAAKNKAQGEWMQIDLGEIRLVAGVATKGRSNFSQWVKTYKVQVGETTSSLIDVDGGKLFGGNSNRSTKVEQTFAKPVMARYVRILPMSWTGHVSMRAAVLVEECVPEESESTDPSEEECQAKESKNACLMRKCGWNEKKEKVPTAWPLV